MKQSFGGLLTNLLLPGDQWFHSETYCMLMNIFIIPPLQSLTLRKES